MKANEAPEKLYLINDEGEIILSYDPLTELKYGDRYDYVDEEVFPIEEGCEVEYTRTDAFIEKACSWLKNHYMDYMYNTTGKRLEAFFGGDMCNDFEDYMKGK